MLFKKYDNYGVFFMEDRHKKILGLFLLHSETNLLVQEIAENIDVSEKTVRNDFKEIDEWLKVHSTALLIRKRSKGVSLEITDEERKRLISKLNIIKPIDNSDDEIRIFEILKAILNKHKTFTIKELSERFYVSKSIIKKDIETIDYFLTLFNLKLTTKQKIGIVVEGEERNRRNAMLRFLELSRKNNPSSKHLLESLFQHHEITFVEGQLKKLENELPLPLTEGSLKNLVIHLLIAIQRIKLKNQIVLPIDELQVIKNRKEFIFSKKLAQKIGYYFALKFPEHEIAYIALRVLGGKLQYPSFAEGKPTIQIDPMALEFLEEIISRISKMTNIDFKQDELLYHGLSIHLHSTFNRLRHHLPISNPMVIEIKKMYPYMFQMIYSVINELPKDLLTEIPEDEMAYLVLHFQSALERINKLSGENKRALIVCSMGIGMSQLLKSKLERKFHSLEIVGCIPSSQLKAVKNSEKIDFVITTLPVETDIPAIEISPLLFDYEQQKLEEFIKNLERNSNLSILKDFLNEDFMFMHLETVDRFDAIEKITKELFNKGMVKEEYIISTLQREKTSSTSIGGGIAIPHGDPNLVINPVIAIATFKQPINWGNEHVSIIFVLAYKQTDSTRTKQLFHDFSNLSENYALVEKLKQQTIKRDFIELL